MKAFGVFDHAGVALKQLMLFMVDLGYIEADNGNLNFTQVGLNYLWNKQQNFVSGTLSKLETVPGSIADKLVGQIMDDFSMRGNNITDKFRKENTVPQDPLASEVDYNEAVFGKKDEEELEG
jgi:hypothetical protein